MELGKQAANVLSLLAIDPRMPFSKIAKELGISKNTAKYHVDKLFEDGFVKVKVKDSVVPPS